MTVKQLAALIDARVLNQGDLDREITGGVVCDLLSWVMANGGQGMAWVTVQTHLNVLAVAALHDLSCIILPEGIKMEGAPLEKAKEEGINVLGSSLSAYEICGLMYANGIK
ncbi:MAG TPA: AraC family transcriptional regulator [Firmicutes bacterium]|nr:AraC family transcriptional regulator [Bacillota bacterium]